MHKEELLCLLGLALCCNLRLALLASIKMIKLKCTQRSICRYCESFDQYSWVLTEYNRLEKMPLSTHLTLSLNADGGDEEHLDCSSEPCLSETFLTPSDGCCI